MYTANVVESIHSSFRKVTQKGAFTNENTILKVLYLRVKERETKWEGGHIQTWSLVMNRHILHHAWDCSLSKYQPINLDTPHFIECLFLYYNSITNLISLYKKEPVINPAHTTVTTT